MLCQRSTLSMLYKVRKLETQQSNCGSLNNKLIAVFVVMILEVKLYSAIARFTSLSSDSMPYCNS